MDVLEIDAASHTGIDDVRDTIIENIDFNPARDRYKVFIIDEVHQLSKAAFNALLKTLEEPPQQRRFCHGDDRAAQGARDDPVAMPGVRISHDPAAKDL